MSDQVQREVEIKSLLADKAEQDQVLAKMKQLDPNLRLKKHVVQHNHYFSGTDFTELLDKLPGLDDNDRAALRQIAERATSTSLRTRDVDADHTLLVLKGAMGSDSPDHAVQRLEFEKTLQIPQSDLDSLVVQYGFDVLSKWYAERDQYQYKDVTVELMFSPGYGYMSEVEYVANADDDANSAEEKVRSVMAELGLAELPGERLGRMFKFYNEHWQDYYGSRNTFILE